MSSATRRLPARARIHRPAVATAAFKNGDVFGDTRGYRNGHTHHPPATYGLATEREDAPPTHTPHTSEKNNDDKNKGVISEGLFASLDDGIVDATDRVSSASINVVPEDLLLPNPATMDGGGGGDDGGDGGSGGGGEVGGLQEMKQAEAEQQQQQRKSSHSSSGGDDGAAEFNVGDESRWPAFPETLWEFNESTAMARGAMGPLVAPPWRVMLLSDGSVTRHLQLLTDAKASLFSFSFSFVFLFISYFQNFHSHSSKKKLQKSCVTAATFLRVCVIFPVSLSSHLIHHAPPRAEKHRRRTTTALRRGQGGGAAAQRRVPR